MEEILRKNYDFTGLQLLNLLKTFAITHVCDFMEREISHIEADHIEKEAFDILENEKFINMILMIREDTTIEDVNKMIGDD